MSELLAQIRQHTKTAAQWTSANPILKLGQKGIEIDTKLEKTGDGINAWNSLPYLQVRAEDVIGLINTDTSGLVPKTTTVNSKALFSNIVISASDIGLGNVDNTSDMNKPVSTAQALADTAILNAAEDYADGLVGLVGGVVLLKGVWDASTGSFPSTIGRKAGWSYIVSVAGIIDGISFNIDDLLIAIVDSASSTTYLSNWYKNDTGIVQGAELSANKSISVNTDQVSNTKYPSVKAVYDWAISLFATISSLSAYAQLAVTQSFTKAQRVAPATLASSAANIAVDFALSNNFSHTLTENTTLANPTNLVAGQSGQITLTQHASAAKTLAFGSYWKSADGTVQTISTTVSAINVITYYVNSTTHITFNLIKHGVV